MTGESTTPAAATANVAATGTDTVQATTAVTTDKPSEGGDVAKPETTPNAQATTDTTEEGKPTGEAAKEGEAEGAPEAYADFTMPEGMDLEPESATAFKDLAKEWNLSQANAQKAVDLASGLVKKTIDGFMEQAAATREKWAEQAKVDPVVGGPKYAENVQVALEAVGKFGDPELKQAFEEFGLGNHPAFVRAFYRIGKAMSESGFVHGQGNEQPAKSGSREQQMVARIAAEQSRNPVAKKL